jgi:hypothetical protein
LRSEAVVVYRLDVAARKPSGPTQAEIRAIIESLVSGRRITRDLTHTAAFKRWFRNSAVVNEAGDPMVVYHGTTATFDAFKSFYRKGEMLGFGVHFAEDVEIAAKYAFEKGVARKGATPRLIAAFLSVQNPLIADAVVREGSREFALAKKMWTTNFFAPKDENDVRGVWLQGAIDRASSAKRAEKLIRDAGYDGVRYMASLRAWAQQGYVNETGRSTSWIVFDPTQIKSATDNIGTFDPTRESIVNPPRGMRRRR